jgi:hypothetical protein
MGMTPMPLANMRPRKVPSEALRNRVAQAVALRFTPPASPQILAFASSTLVATLAIVLYLQHGVHPRPSAIEHSRTAPHAVTKVAIRHAPAPVKPVAVLHDADAGLSRAQLINRWQPLIVKASRRFGVPQSWIRAVMLQESGGRTTLNGQKVVSRAGAMGLMQLLPETYREMRVRYRLGADIFNPRDNILAGTAYLKDLRNQYGFPALFAAYNAGPRQLGDDLASGHALPAETQTYVERVGRMADPSAVQTGEGIWQNYLRLRSEALGPKPPSTLNAAGQEAARLATLTPEGREAARLASLPVKDAIAGP